MRVLIADDQKEVAFVLAEMVRGCGHQVVDVAGSGLEAIRAFRRHKPDAVLMDFYMSKLNGLTACRNILSVDPTARIILISGLMPAETLSLSCVGATAFLPKPVSIANLQQLLDSVDAAPATQPHVLRDPCHEEHEDSGVRSSQYSDQFTATALG